MDSYHTVYIFIYGIDFYCINVVKKIYTSSLHHVLCLSGQYLLFNYSKVFV